MRDETDFLIVDDPRIPDGVPLVSSFHDWRNCLSYYYPKLKSTRARIPNTQFFLFEYQDGTAPPDFDDRAVAIWMREHGYQQAFVRSDYSSAKLHARKGSLVYRPEPDVVRDTVAEMIAQHIMQRRFLGRYLVSREWIDLDYCPSRAINHFHHNEVRYIVRNGEVVYHTPGREAFYEKNMGCNDLYSYVREDLYEDRIDFPHEQAESVAEEFDRLAWSVDFVRDAKTGKWFCTDMGLDGLYWEPDEETWISISGHGDNSPVDPEQYADEMPPIEVFVDD